MSIVFVANLLALGSCFFFRCSVYRACSVGIKISQTVLFNYNLDMCQTFKFCCGDKPNDYIRIRKKNLKHVYGNNIATPIRWFLLT